MTRTRRSRERQPRRAAREPSEQRSGRDRGDQGDDREDRRRGRSRKRNTMDPTMLAALCIGALILIAGLVVALGNQQPPPPAPKRGENVQLVKKVYDAKGNELTAAEAEALRQKNKEIQKAKKEARQPASGETAKKAEPKVVERRRGEILLEQQTGERVEAQGVATDTDRSKAPTPGWATDTSGRTIGGGNAAAQPAPAPDPNAQNKVGKDRVSPLAPWKSRGGDGETP